MNTSKHRLLGRLRGSWSRAVILGLAAGLLVIAFVVYNPSSEQAPTSTPNPSRTDSPDPPPTPSNTPDDSIVHADIIATVFWVGEAASEDNDYIQNRSSAWQEDWMGHYGGEDDPENRCGYKPCAFTPKENPFYFALPFNDYRENGEPKPAAVLKTIPWYTGQPKAGTSLVKNYWVEITRGDATAYAQWEDVGPFGEDDVAYVFGTSKPQESRAGIDLSPATADYLSIDGRGTVKWRFIDASQVPTGPWKETITDSGLKY